MAGARKRQKRGGGTYRDWEGWYYDRFGRRVFFKGFATKAKTLEVAYKKEAQEREARILGIAPDTFVDRDCEEVMKEYLAWGEASGGRGGRPWSPVHARTRRNQLAFFLSELKLGRVSELRGRLADVEAVLRRLRTKKLSPRTVFSYGESLSAFCAWCVERGFMSENPFAKLRAGSRAAIRKRRAFTPDELRRVLGVAPEPRKLVYLVAVMTGYRAKELAALRVSDFDAARSSLRLSGESTKNRKSAEQPLPSFIVELLEKACRGRATSEKLLSLPSHTARELDTDMSAAGVVKTKDEGILDFHCLRVTYITWLAESGAHPGEVQELARHASPDLTFGVYARSGMDRKRVAVDLLATGLIENP